MAYSNIDSLQLGTLLQIVFSNGVRNQISQDFRDFEMVKRQKAGSSVARELRFMLQKAYGTSAIQYRDPGTSGRSFPTAQQATVQEFTAKFKEINATIELEYNLWDRARKSPEKYAEPLALEIDSKSSAAKRRIAADLYGDGTGVVGTIASNSGGVVSLSTSDTARGHVGFFEYGDILVHKAANGGAGSAVTVGSGTFSHWVVDLKDRANQSITLIPVNTAGAQTTVSAWTASAGEVFYRYQQPTGALSALNLGPIGDYGTASEVIAGLESLTANDGRVIHGITMSGALAGSRLDAGGNPIDVKYVQKAMSQVKVNVGQDRYSWKMMCMAPESLDSLIESRETDRRFMAAEDGKRGTKKFMYLHQNDELECYTSEYVPPKRIYILPETKAGEKVIEFHGSDFETVKAQGMGDFHLKPASAGGYVNTVVSYLQSIGVIVCKHPASIAVIHNFTNS